MQLINLRSRHNRHEYVIWNPVTFLLSSHLYCRERVECFN